jgi:hypothetical protein
MTKQEWQERYMIMSTKGKIWTRSEIAKRAIDFAHGVLLGAQPRSVIRVEVERVLDDDKFMRQRYGMVPARVIEDAAWEAFFKLAPKTPEAKP